MSNMEDLNERTSAQRLAKPGGTNRECGLFLRWHATTGNRYTIKRTKTAMDTIIQGVAGAGYCLLWLLCLWLHADTAGIGDKI